MPEEEFEDVLRFWFPQHLSDNHAAMLSQFEWWFRGGADTAIAERFAELLQRAARGDLDHWADEPRSRLALIIVLDQFSRSVHRVTPRAFAQDAKALALALEGMEIGHYAALETPWERTFFFLPLGHSEELAHLTVAVELAEQLAEQAPANCARFWSTRRRRRAAIATSSPVSVAILTVTPSWGGHRRRRNSTTWPAANSCTRVRCRTDPEPRPGQSNWGVSLPVMLEPFHDGGHVLLEAAWDEEVQ